MKKFKKTMPLKKVAEYNPISRAYDYNPQENPVEKTESKCTVSTQKKPLDECDDRFFYYYTYSQKENLVEQDDIDFTVPAEEVQQIELISFAIEHSSSQVRDTLRSDLHIDQAFFTKLKNLCAQAYTLYLKCGAENIERCNSKYHFNMEYHLKTLYYASMEAVYRLDDARTTCKKAMSALSFYNERTLIDSIEKLEDMIGKLSTILFGRANRLEHYIQDPDSVELY